MSKETFLSRFSLIIKRLERGPATFEQLRHHLETESGIHGKNFNLSIRTLQRDIRDINDQFGIEIINERKGDKRYLIKDSTEGQPHTRRILEAYDMLQIVRYGQELSDFIFFESRRPFGLEHSELLIHACRNKKVLEFSHLNYTSEIQSYRVVHPLALKEARGRWYLVAVDTGDNKLKTFGLDRMENLTVSKTSYRTSYPVNVFESFDHSFGIINDENLAPQKILLLCSKHQGHYLETYPIHHTQHRVEIKNNGDIVLQLNLKITYDLVMELLSFGETVKVLSPKTLVSELVRKGRKMIKQYQS